MLCCSSVHSIEEIGQAHTSFHVILYSHTAERVLHRDLVSTGKEANAVQILVVMAGHPAESTAFLSSSFSPSPDII